MVSIMNSYEKLLMWLVPSVGLTIIIYFFACYLPNNENVHFYDNQRLQGPSYQYKVSYRKTDTLTAFIKNIKYHNVKKNKTYKKNYIKWKDNNDISFMSESLKNKKYKQTDNYIPQTASNQTSNVQDAYLRQRRLQLQIQSREQKKFDKKINDQECSYYEEKKERAVDRMKRGYTASQYNRLDNQRKYWAKKYSHNCFDGYQYPR